MHQEQNAGTRAGAVVSVFPVLMGVCTKGWETPPPTHRRLGASFPGRQEAGGEPGAGRASSAAGAGPAPAPQVGRPQAPSAGEGGARCRMPCDP